MHDLQKIMYLQKIISYVFSISTSIHVLSI